MVLTTYKTAAVKKIQSSATTIPIALGITVRREFRGDAGAVTSTGSTRSVGKVRTTVFSAGAYKSSPSNAALISYSARRGVIGTRAIPVASVTAVPSRALRGPRI